jgi:predicted Fe-S protein YdhL (DUF1289 family)
MDIVKNKQGYVIAGDNRECTSCGTMYKQTSKTVTLCNKCNSERVMSEPVNVKMWRRAKRRAFEKGLDFNITPSDVVVPDKCPILGMPLVVFKGKSGGRPDSPALDRIDNSKGYVKGNVAVISHLANCMKSSATDEQLILFSKWVFANIQKKTCQNQCKLNESKVCTGSGRTIQEIKDAYSLLRKSSPDHVIPNIHQKLA